MVVMAVVMAVVMVVRLERWSCVCVCLGDTTLV